MRNNVDPDQLALSETSWSESTRFSKEGLELWKKGDANRELYRRNIVHLDFGRSNKFEYVLIFMGLMWATMVLTSLHIHAVWSGPLLFGIWWVE